MGAMCTHGFCRVRAEGTLSMTRRVGKALPCGCRVHIGLESAHHICCGWDLIRVRGVLTESMAHITEPHVCCCVPDHATFVF